MKNKITILGLGAGDLEQIPFGVYKKLTAGGTVYLRTKEHPVVADLEAGGAEFESFDSVYEKHDNFPEVYEEITETLLEAAESKDIVYAVPGHPLVAERTVQLLLERGSERGIEIKIGGGQSFLDAIFQALKIDPVEGFQLLDGTDMDKDRLIVSNHLIIGQVYDRFIASDVKLTLMEKLPDEYEVAIVKAAGSQTEKVTWLPLYELDRMAEVDNLTSVYVPPFKNDMNYREFSTLRGIIAQLRGPEGCPWDRKQTHESLRKYLIEEAYELIEAINNDDIDNIIEELGDVLLQVVLHAQIGEDDGYFSIEDVIEGVSEKMVRRHPHVFGDVVAEDEESVMKNWQEIKLQEKGVTGKSVLSGAEKGQPQTLKAAELQKIAAKHGFDWPDIEPVMAKIIEELEELKEAAEAADADSMEAEFGDLLFALVNLSRHYKIDPEIALARTNAKFARRFHYIEERVAESGKPFGAFSLEELDVFWDEAKEKGL